MKVLELFSGTHSVGKCCKELGIESLSLDIDGRADITMSILDWDYKVYDKDEFDIIWASPPCATFSHLQNSWVGRVRNGEVFTMERMEHDMVTIGDPLVIKTLEIIEYFNPTYWFMENPASGRLKYRSYMKDIPFYTIDYCMYSDWGYRKRTNIWTNKKDWKPLKCDNKGTCGNMINNIHKTNLGNNKRSQQAKWMMHQNDVSYQGGGGSSLDLRYRIPPDLIYSLFLE